MRRSVRVLVALSAATAAGATALVVLPATTPGPTADRDPAVDELASLTTGPLDLRRDPTTGAAGFVGTDPGRPLDLGTDGPTQAGRAFVDDFGGLLGAGDTDLVDIGHTPSLTGGVAVRFQQQVDGVPVFGGQASVQVDRDGGVLSSLADLSPRAEEAPSRARVLPGVARVTAIEAVARDTGAPAGALEATIPEAQVYDPVVVGADDTFGVRLTWLVEVTGSIPPVRHLVLVDATTGAIALSFSQLTLALDREVCDFANVANADETCISPVRIEGGPATGVADVNRAYDFSGAAHSYYAAHFGRDGVDDAGSPLVSSVRYCQTAGACPYANAFWNGEQLTFGAGYATDDVVAHELTHGLTEHTANLFYWYQSGAINESMSDVFGELIDLATGSDDTPANRWLIGEDLAGGYLRDMADPPARSDPDSTAHAAYVPGPTDAGGVHSNSGVNNKAAYLMADGGTFGGYQVTALGPDKVAALYYEVLTTLLTSASDFQDLHAALPQACANLVTGGVAGLTAGDCLEVRDAVDAVGMNVVPPAAPATDVAVCAQGQPVADLFTDDLEVTNDGRWTYQQSPGAFRWGYQSESQFSYATSGDQGFYGPTTGATADRSVVMSAAVDLPPESHPVLHFRHAYGFESSSGSNWDGGVVEYSTTGLGGPWLDLGPMIEANGYDGTLMASGSNPIKGRPAFVDESQGYLSSRVDLSPLAGEDVRIRFRVGEDSVVGDYGWFIDDVRVADCPNPVLAIDQVADQADVVAGEDIDLHLTLHNEGNVDLTGLDLSTTTAPECDQALADLAPGASVTVDCTHTTIDPDDVGTWTNTTTVTATELPPPGVTSSPVAVTVAAPVPAVSVDVSATPGIVTVGEDVDVSVTVENTGNVDLTGLAVTVAAAPDCTGPVADLGVGDDVVVDCAYTTVDPDDLGPWSASAEVTADQLDGATTSAPASVNVLAPGTAAMDVGHRAEESSVPLGDPVTLTVTVLNTGNVALTDVVVVSPQAPDCAAGPLTEPIPVDGDHVIVCSYTPTAVGPWTSTVSATSAELPTPESSPTVEVDVLDVTPPVITLTSPGDGALYNRGQVVVTDVTCVDDQDGPLPCEGDAADGEPVDTSTVGTHTFRVTATDAAGNEAEVEHTYSVARRRPDGRIRVGLGGVTVGDGRYNATGEGQTRTTPADPGDVVTHYVTVQNDGTHPEALRVGGQASTANYQVRYLTGGVDISVPVRNGTYTTPVLAPGAFRTIKVVVTVGARAPGGSRIERAITTTSTRDPLRVDVVKFIVRRR